MTRRPTKTPPVVALMLIALGSPAAAQEGAGELVTDRPDQTESSVVVPPGYVQIEAGWTFTRNDDGGARLEVHELPGTLVRIGVAERVELRIGWSGLVFEELRGRDLPFVLDQDGAGDAELGAKIYLGEERGARPEIALLVASSVPVGEDAFTTDAFDPSFRLSLAHTLSERLSLGYNLGMEWETGAGDDGRERTLGSAIYTLALGIGLSERWGAFVELFGTAPTSAAGGPANSFDGGFTYLIRDNMQLDVAGGVGLSDAADDWFVGVGFSVRVPD
ncbi:MAG: transporter [Acidobacteria bacterium]|nr:MAG: transporter [Acidobacteriota bacterium]